MSGHDPSAGRRAVDAATAATWDALAGLPAVLRLIDAIGDRQGRTIGYEDATAVPIGLVVGHGYPGEVDRGAEVDEQTAAVATDLAIEEGLVLCDRQVGQMQVTPSPA